MIEDEALEEIVIIIKETFNITPGEELKGRLKAVLDRLVEIA
jgi:hypothetical protein